MRSVTNKQPESLRDELLKSCRNLTKEHNDQAGFSLVEVVIAMLVLLIALLGVFVAFTAATSFNAGNDSRAEAIAILQGEVEFLRSAKFTSGTMDASLAGGTRARVTVTGVSGNSYNVDVAIDDDPSTAGIQIDNARSLKEVIITVSLASPTPGWQTSVPATVRFLRARGN